MSKLVLYANPYDISATGFYFSTEKEYEKKYAKNRNEWGGVVEEYMIEFIDGSDEDAKLAQAIGLDQGNFVDFLELVDGLEDHEKAALYYLLTHRGMGPKENLEDLVDMVSDVPLFAGSPKDYVYEYVEGVGVENLGPDMLSRLVDYEQLGRDLKRDYDSDDPRQDVDDYELGEEFVEDVGLSPTMAQQYFDHDALLRDMEAGGEIHDFTFADIQYTVAGFRGNRRRRRRRRSA